MADEALGGMPMRRRRSVATRQIVPLTATTSARPSSVGSSFTETSSQGNGWMRSVHVPARVWRYAARIVTPPKVAVTR